MKRITLVMTALSALYSGSGCVGVGEEDGVETRKEEIVTNGPSFPWTPNDLCTVSRPDGTFSTTMLCCPPGQAMVGYSPDWSEWWGGTHYLEWAKCKPFTSTGPRTVDTSTQRSFPSPLVGGAPITMHACPLGSVMVGIHLALNRFACQQNAAPILPGAAGEVFDRMPETEAPYANARSIACGNVNSTRAMSGYRHDMGKLGCANDTTP
jgi:hypothetical protein